MNPVRRLKNHIDRHRFAYGVGTGLTIGAVLLLKQGEQWNTFLTDNDLWDKFYDYSSEV